MRAAGVSRFTLHGRVSPLSTPDRLAELCEQHGIPQAMPALEALLGALVDQAAPTTVHEPGEAVDVHLADALTALAVPAVRQAGHIADLGSGAGVPGLVLAAALPSARVTLVESVARKGAFIESTVARMSLGNVQVVVRRAEEWREGMGACDVVTARALAPLPVLCEYAAPLLRLGGTLVAWKGRVGSREGEDGVAAASRLGLQPGEILHTAPFAASRGHTLHLYSKVEETPERFPRRAGIAAKRPLGAQSKALPEA
jgi:16S rRNA (guanine527-N7)-methyltransferase